MPKLFGSRAKATPAVNLDRLSRAAAPPHPVVQVKKPSVRRAFERKDAWAVCKVILKFGHEREGVLLDLSDGGARVRFRSRGQLSPTVRIVSGRMGLDRMAKVVWQDTFDAGLQFVDADDASA